MPIKPENRALYPKDWPAISLEARERAGWRCVHRHADGSRCGAMQYAVGAWDRESPASPWQWEPIEGNRPATTKQDREFFMAGEGRDAKGDRWTYSQARTFVDRWWGPEEEERPIVIVLTVAHLNHDPTDCRPENLAAMCQRHHLAYDHDHHRANAQATRRAKAGTLELF